MKKLLTLALTIVAAGAFAQSVQKGLVSVPFVVNGSATTNLTTAQVKPFRLQSSAIDGSIAIGLNGKLAAAQAPANVTVTVATSPDGVIWPTANTMTFVLSADSTNIITGLSQLRTNTLAWGRISSIAQAGAQALTISNLTLTVK